MLSARWEVLEDGRYRAVIVDTSQNPTGCVSRVVWRCDHGHYAAVGYDDPGFDSPDFKSAKLCAREEIARRRKDT